MRKLAIAFLLVVSVQPAFADTEIVEGIEWTYTTNGPAATVGMGSYDSPAISKGSSGAIAIPATLGGFPVTSIGNYAFSGCSELTSVTVPNGVTSIGNWAFYNCSGLTSITIPNSVSSIGDFAFYNCSGLKSITIPDSVTNIGSAAFYGCSDLTSVIIDENNPFFDSRNNCNAIIRVADNTLIVGCKNTTIPDSVTSIGDYAFEGCFGLTSVTIPDSVTSFGDRAFYNCSGLTSITISDSVTSIGDCVFYNCSGLKSITIPDSVTSFGNCAFYNCSELTSITIPNSVTNIGDEAFAHCSGLMSIVVDANNPIFDSRNNCNAVIRTSDNVLVVGCKTTTIPDSVTIIENSAFYCCSGLMSVTIPNSVTSIGNYAFNGCSGLTSVTIPGSVTNIGGAAFSGCSGLTSVIIPNSVTSIGGWTFSGCSGLTSVTIPNSVTSIGGWTFSGCSGLTSVTIPNSVTNIGRQAFSNCSRLTSITIPDSVTSIGDRAFYNCSGLTSITIPDNVTGIGTDMFSGCSRIISVVADPKLVELFNGWYSFTIPDGVTSIESRAFLGRHLGAITIPDSVTNIGNQAFMCEYLQHVNFRGNAPETVEPSAFSPGVLVSPTIHVRPESTGWGVDIPGTWNGLPIDYGLVYPVLVSVSGNGSCDFEMQWVEEGTTVTAEIVPTIQHYTITVSGDTNGVTLVGTTLTIPSDGPRSIAVTVSETKLALDVTTAHGTPTPAGRTNWSWGDTVTASVATDDPADGVRYVCTGWAGTGNAPASGTATNVAFTIEEDSTLTWNWRTDFLISVSVAGCGECEFTTQWIEEGQTVTAEIVPAMPLYTISLSGDTDGVSLSGTTLTIPADRPRDILATVKTSVSMDEAEIPFSWLEENAAAAVAAADGDYEAAARATAANGENKVWECYVAGLDPANVTNRFLAEVVFNENGVPVVSWTPDLNEGGTKSKRVYTVEGKTNLLDATWGPTNESARFFRVKVSMP